MGNKEESEGEEEQKKLENSGEAYIEEPAAEAAIRKELADFYGLEEHHIKIEIRD